MEFVIRLLDWFKENPTNAVVWNALPSKEARDSWLVHILHDVRGDEASCIFCERRIFNDITINNVVFSKRN